MVTAYSTFNIRLHYHGIYALERVVSGERRKNIYNYYINWRHHPGNINRITPDSCGVQSVYVTCNMPHGKSRMGPRIMIWVFIMCNGNHVICIRVQSWFVPIQYLKNFSFHRNRFHLPLNFGWGRRVLNHFELQRGTRLRFQYEHLSLLHLGLVELPASFWNLKQKRKWVLYLTLQNHYSRFKWRACLVGL